MLFGQGVFSRESDLSLGQQTPHSGDQRSVSLLVEFERNANQIMAQQITVWPRHCGRRQSSSGIWIFGAARSIDLIPNSASAAKREYLDLKNQFIIKNSLILFLDKKLFFFQ